jgi:hypothetical protein
MKTQAWGWLAAGVLALGLNGIYHDGGAAWAHRAADRVMDRVIEKAGPVLALASGHAKWFKAKTGMAVAREETASCRLATAVTRFHAKIARSETGFAQIQAMSARQQVALARMEAQRARIEAQVARVRFAPVAFETLEVPVMACPRGRVNIPRVSVPRVPMMRVPAPVVHVEVMGAGPI